MKRKISIGLVVVATFAVVLWAQDPVLVLKDGGIEFPDGSIQETAAVAPFVLNSSLDPVKTFSVVREHQYTGVVDPSVFPLPLKEGGMGGAMDMTDQPPNHQDPGLDPQLRLGLITPCVGVIGTVNNFVVTGIHVSMSTVPGATGFLESMVLGEFDATGAPAPGRRYEAFHVTSYHDSSGIRMSGQNAMGLVTRVRVSGSVLGNPPVLSPAMFKVVTVISGYCADENQNPPQNN